MANQSKGNRRAGVLAVHSVDHTCLAVPDLSAARKFYTAFGLEAREESGVLNIYAKGSPHRWIKIIEGPRKKLQYLSFGAYADDMPAFAERLKKLGIKQIDAPKSGGTGGLWFASPDGVALEIRPAEKVTADQKSGTDLRSTPGGVVAAYGRSKAPVVHPRRLAHVLLFTPDVLGAIRFHEQTLGLRLSDRSADIVAFLHAPHGCDHHLLAFAKSDGPGLHHFSWDVASVNDVGLGAAQMAAAGYKAGWGVGRHVLGSNYFFYVRDPWGSHSEYSADIDYIPKDMDWPAGDHPVEDSFYLWGPDVPEDFTKNFETAR